MTRYNEYEWTGSKLIPVVTSWKETYKLPYSVLQQDKIATRILHYGSEIYVRDWTTKASGD